MGFPIIRLVLVQPKYAGNVGSCARVAANFGVNEFYAVEPQCSLDEALAELFATGNSRQTLKNAKVVATLQEALTGCDVAIAVARRAGENHPDTLDLRTVASRLMDPNFAQERVAIVLGREDNCLTLDEMKLCTYQLPIPTDEFMPTMNLSHAAAAVLSRIFSDANPDAAVEMNSRYERLSTVDEFEHLIVHIEEVMRDVDLVEAGNPERLLKCLRLPLQRARLKRNETAALRALLSKIQVALGVRSRKGNNSGRV